MAVASKTSGGKISPKLRFPGFNEEWEEKQLGEIFNELTESVGDRKIETYSITAGVGLISQKEKFGRNISGRQNSKYIVLKPNQFTYNKGNSKTYKYGCIYLNNENKEIAVPNVFISFEMKDHNMASEFFAKLFESHYLDRSLKKIISSTARMDGLLNVNKGSFFKLKIKLPKSPEQQKIADFLSTVDDWIENLKREKEQLEKYKKGMMQQIFSQKIRFKADDGKAFPEWEEKKLGEVLSSISTKPYQIQNSEIQTIGKFKVVDQGQKKIAGFSDDETKLFKNEEVIIFGDHTTVIKYIDFDFVVGADGTKILKSDKNNNLKYIFFNLTFRNIKSEGYKRHFSILKNIKLQIPSYFEQKIIADFLSSIDTFIEDRAKQIRKAKKWKKGLMQQLFI